MIPITIPICQFPDFTTFRLTGECGIELSWLLDFSLAGQFEASGGDEYSLAIDFEIGGHLQILHLVRIETELKREGKALHPTCGLSYRNGTLRIVLPISI